MKARSVRPRLAQLGAALALGALAATASGTASARKLINQPGAHPKHNVELEPHAHLRSTYGRGLGLGIRATWMVADRGFITKVNDSFGIGFGGDYTFDLHRCNGRTCRDEGELIVPIAGMWSFWFTENWSAFGELGVYLPFLHPVKDDGLFFIQPQAAVGGRFMLSDSVSLTLRLGSPTASFGASFFL